MEKDDPGKCKLHYTQKRSSNNNPHCTYFPVLSGNEKCWHYLKSQGRQSDAPKLCPRLICRRLKTSVRQIS